MTLTALRTSGIVRKVDQLGRIVIPQELRRNHGINVGTPLEVMTDASGNLVLRIYSDTCSNCGAVGEELYGTSKICPSCISKLSKQIRK